MHPLTIMVCKWHMHVCIDIVADKMFSTDAKGVSNMSLLQEGQDWYFFKNIAIGQGLLIHLLQFCKLAKIYKDVYII